MSFQPQLIAPFQVGLDTDLEPWIAPEDSFSILDNIHVHNAYLEKRSGFQLFANTEHPTTPIEITGITQANPGEVTTAIPHGYISGDLVLIESVVGMIEVNDLTFTIIVTGDSTFTIGVNTTGFTAYISDGTTTLIDPDVDRIMGLWRFIRNDNTKDLLAFTTRRANLYVGGTVDFAELDTAAIMSGSVTDYVVAYNWQGSGLDNRLYFTNGKAFDGVSLDGIRFYDGNGATTTDFNANSLGGGRVLFGCKLIFTLKQRLVVFNTFEFNGAITSNFPQRARWCQAQGPANWDDLVAGGGGFVDAPTGEQIVSAQLLQDIIIVMFTNSVWTFRPVPDPALPFRWDRINDFRACDGKMATIGYDREVRALGVRGITGTDGVETRRIDKRIEDFTTDEINIDEFEKVFCLRSFEKRRWWTLFARGSDEENSAALIWDDESSAFSTYTIAMNCLGYGNAGFDYRLSDFTADNGLDFAIKDFAEETIQSYFNQENQEIFLGGDIQGTVFIMERGGDDEGEPISTEMFSAAWNPFKQQGIECQMSYIDFFIDSDKLTTATVEFFKNNDRSPYLTQSINFLPNLDFIADIGGASNTNPVNINAPSHGLTTGDIIFIYLVEGTVEVNGGPHLITVTDENNFILDGIDGTAFGVYTTGGQVVRREFFRTKTWKRAYGGGYGYQHRIRVLSTGNDRPFRFHAFKPYFRARGSRTIN